MSKAVLQLSNITRAYRQGDKVLEVLRGVNLTIQPGEIVALLGPSGSGKSTLLQIAGLLDTPDGGSIVVNGKECATLSEGKQTLLRRHQLGFVYQFHHLLPECSAQENVAMPLLFAGVSTTEARRKASALLEMMQLSERADHRPSELSGGEQQRVAIARALANDPLLVLGDEPTGNLDPHTGEIVFNAFSNALKSRNAAAFIATHNMALAERADRVVRLEGGRLV